MSKTVRRTRDGKVRKAVSIYIEEDAYNSYANKAKALGSPWTVSSVMVSVLEGTAKNVHVRELTKK